MVQQPDLLFFFHHVELDEQLDCLEVAHDLLEVHGLLQPLLAFRHQLFQLPRRGLAITFEATANQVEEEQLQLS